MAISWFDMIVASYEQLNQQQKGKHIMNNATRIKQARSHLTNGNVEAYKRLLNAALRSSMSARTTNMILAAAKQDNINL